jgi:translocation and assembly module TamA
MGHTRRRTLLAAILLGSALPFAAPAPALELFGIRLWGGEEDEEVVEVIDPIRYEITFEVDTDREELQRVLRDASALWADRDAPAPGRAGLIAKARGDYRRLLAALYNAGHYGPEISITLAGREAAEVTLADPLPPELPVAVTIRPGPRFRFGVAEIVNAPPWTGKRHPGAVDFEVGATARATRVGAASQLAVERWRQISHAKAQESARDLVADHTTNLLEARIFIDPGRAAVYGPVQVVGRSRVDDDFIAYMADLEPGSSFNSDELDAAQARLVRLGAFNLVQFEEGEEIAPDGTLPITIRVEDRLPRSFGIGASFGSPEGLAFEGFWLHRNLFGRAEQLRLDATIARIGTTKELDDLTYQAGVSFVRPGVIEPNTNLVTSLIGRQQDLDTYRERAITGRIGLARDFGSELSGEVALEATRSRVEDAFGVRHFLTVGPDVRLQYDRRDNLLNPTEGYFLLANARPFYEAEFGNFAARGTLEGRAYRALDLKGRFVLAGRARIGSYVGPGIEESPPDQLLFSGGGGSVRGYDFRSIGIEATLAEGETDVVGGRSLFELSTEIRTRFGENFGLVGFVDGGYVAEDSGFGGESELRFGAGLGIRYFTGLGPLRVDLATPIDRRPQDSQLALYIGIGQAF